MDTNTEAKWEFERAEIVARCIEIARECLEGDPFRECPTLEVAAWQQFERYDGGDPKGCTAKGLPAYAVAELALSTAKMAGRAY